MSMAFFVCEKKCPSSPKRSTEKLRILQVPCPQTMKGTFVLVISLLFALRPYNDVVEEWLLIC